MRIPRTGSPGTTPICSFCGRPVLNDVRYGNAGEPYHRACTEPPPVTPRLTKLDPESSGETIRCGLCGVEFGESVLRTCGAAACPMGSVVS